MVDIKYIKELIETYSVAIKVFDVSNNKERADTLRAVIDDLKEIIGEK